MESEALSAICQHPDLPTPLAGPLCYVTVLHLRRQCDQSLRSQSAQSPQDVCKLPTGKLNAIEPYMQVWRHEFQVIRETGSDLGLMLVGRVTGIEPLSA